jgi:hypothetical protein
MTGILPLNLKVTKEIVFFLWQKRPFRKPMIPQLIVCDDNIMEPANTCKLQNKLQLNNDQLSECELDSDDFSDETHVP